MSNSVTILIVEKNGSIKEQTIKNFQEEELYKKSGLKTPEGFECKTNWKVNINKKDYAIALYGKTTGRANQENKYEFPPPVDNTLFFGNCILLNTIGNRQISLDEWEMIYEKLYGGFDDLDDDEEDDEDDDDELVGVKTSKGYVKDGFIVGDSDEEEDEDDDDEEDEDDILYVKKTKKTSKKKPAKIVLETIENVEPDDYLNCASELVEDEYEE